MLKAIIFDMDGVLIDSVRYNWESFNELLRKYGVNLLEGEIKKFIGMSTRDKLHLWRKEYNIKEKINPVEFSNQAFKISLKLMKKELKPNKKILSLINSAKKYGIKIAVATSSTKARAEKILGLLKVKKKLDLLITAEDIEKHKPDPQIFLETAKGLNVEPKECVVFEDAINGIQAAKNAGMKSIAIITEFTSKNDFKDLANIVVEDFSDVNLERLRRLFRSP